MYALFNGCDKNYPDTFMIPPHDSICYSIKLAEQQYSTLFKITSTKVGLIYVDPNTYRTEDDYRRFMGDKSQWDRIIWSNPLYLTTPE
ncbi:hypothetical protein [Parabacteroides sp. FAFU027]|uniref:hypothetical protein n=1 Tax=Parabacteroides sp. FAFU027 TaxID=2922715 RepID=UPI001FAEE4A3|nr:hypothetical protein [Parabacteroides sp. FAFU027]